MPNFFFMSRSCQLLGKSLEESMTRILSPPSILDSSVSVLNSSLCFGILPKSLLRYAVSVLSTLLGMPETMSSNSCGSSWFFRLVSTMTLSFARPITIQDLFTIPLKLSLKSIVDYWRFQNFFNIPGQLAQHGTITLSSGSCTYLTIKVLSVFFTEYHSMEAEYRKKRFN